MIVKLFKMGASGDLNGAAASEVPAVVGLRVAQFIAFPFDAARVSFFFCAKIAAFDAVHAIRLLFGAPGCEFFFEIAAQRFCNRPGLGIYLLPSVGFGIIRVFGERVAVSRFVIDVGQINVAFGFVCNAEMIQRFEHGRRSQTRRQHVTEVGFFFAQTRNFENSDEFYRFSVALGRERIVFVDAYHERRVVRIVRARAFLGRFSVYPKLSVGRIRQFERPFFGFVFAAVGLLSAVGDAGFFGFG